MWILVKDGEFFRYIGSDALNAERALAYYMATYPKSDWKLVWEEEVKFIYA